MLTRPGWLCLWGGITLIVLARLLGIGELYVFGAVALGLVAVAVLYVSLTRLDLQVDRVVHPARVHVGQVSRVEVRIRNLRSRATPVLSLRDPVTGTAGAELLVSPLDRGSASVASYRLPTEHRGIVQVGPLEVVIADPFGLAVASTRGAPRVEVTVFPRVDDIRPVPFTSGNDPLAGVIHPHALGRSGDDFYALRPYVVGDDLRRIHWPSTARHDELLVRQQEQPWQARTTVLLDVRRAAHDPDSLESAVSAAASIVSANGARRDLVRLVTTDGSDSGFGAGTTHLQALLEHLAVVEAAGSASLRAMLDLVQRDGQGALIIVVGQTAGEDLGATGRLRQRFGLVSVVRVDGAPRRPGSGERPGAVGPDVIRVTADTPFPHAWNRAIAAASRSRRTIGTLR
ncbi:MAG: DUF58 domain-containing protein [Acidimicrobiales bacterium]|nr:DUF58 domain-containing protein [Acidimicrobiales bacterium]